MNTWPSKKFYSYNNTFHSLLFLKNEQTALVGVAQRTECWLVAQKVAGWIPSQGARVGCGPGPQLGTWDASLAHQCFPPALSHPSSLSKK